MTRKTINPRHPRVNAPLIARIISTRKLEGEYFGKYIISILSVIREELEKLIIQQFNEYEKYRVIFDSLRIIDSLYGEKLIHTHEISRANLLMSNYIMAELNRTMDEGVGHIGKTFERIIEIALSHQGKPKSTIKENKSLLPLYELVSEAVFLNSVMEDFVCLWNRGKLIVYRDNWEFELEVEDQRRLKQLKENRAIDDVQKTQDSYKDDKHDSTIEEYMHALKELSKGTTSYGILKDDPDLEEFIRVIDNEHYKEFNHKYSERLLAILYLAKLPAEVLQDWAFEDTVVQFISKNLCVSTETAHSILEALSITGDDINKENTYPFRFNRRFRLIRRPLPKFRIGNRYAYYLSIPIIGRSYLNTQAEYTDGSHPDLDDRLIKKKLIIKLNQQYTNYFVRERIAKKLKELGFIVEPHLKQIGPYNVEAECGEIDILALSNKKTLLVIGECKFRVKGFINVRQIRQEISDYTEGDDCFVEKLKNKVKWIDEHKREIIELLGSLDIPNDVKCIPVFFINYFNPVSVFIDEVDFVREKDLSSWCRKYMQEILS